MTLKDDYPDQSKKQIRAFSAFTCRCKPKKIPWYDTATAMFVTFMLGVFVGTCFGMIAFTWLVQDAIG